MHTTPAPEEKRKKIEAEKQFDKATYGGMGGIITVLLSIAAGDWVINGSGKEKCLYAAQRAGSAVSRITGAAPAKCVNVIHNAFVTTGLMMGGLITLYPIKKMEDNKPQIVRWFHERNIAKRVASGETISAEEQAENEAALAAVDHAPKQTWGSIFSGRVVGTAAVYASMALVGTPLKKISAHIGQITADNIATPTAHPLVKRITESGTLDAAATAICTSMLYVWSHFLCPPKDTLTPIAANDSITPRTESIPMLVSDTTTNTAHADKLTPTKTYQQHILTTSNELPSIQRL